MQTFHLRGIEIADNHGLKNKKVITVTIQNLQLSRNTNARQIEKMCGNITEQFLKDVPIVLLSHSNWMNLHTSET
jgi:hypothetical protein